MDTYTGSKHKNMCGHERQHIQGGGYFWQEREWDGRRYTEIFNLSVIFYLLKRSEANMAKPEGESIGIHYIINHTSVILKIFRNKIDAKKCLCY